MLKIIFDSIIRTIKFVIVSPFLLLEQMIKLFIKGITSGVKLAVYIISSFVAYKLVVDYLYKRIDIESPKDTSTNINYKKT